jgi:signal transduction histidine kinase/ActR/RegA family two-component response regulator
MTRRGGAAVRGQPLIPVFYDIAQVLESAEDSAARVIRVLDRLRSIVPYERCAVLHALPGREPHLLTALETPAAERAELTDTLRVLLGQLIGDQGPTGEASSSPVAHLAVPLVALDEVVGVLFVRSANGSYKERHLRRLSVVAAKLGAYFSMLRASALEAERASQLEESQQVAERANRTKDEFLALVSHELRTPLNTILAWADALRSKETHDADRTRAFESIERSVRAQARLIEELLDLSCVANATMRLDLRAVEPAKLIKAAILALGSRADQKSIRVEASFDESLTSLVADPQRLSQILVNLIANAIEFTPEGGRVEVRLERAGELALIRVNDTGSGIRPEVLPKLFERFRQADSSSVRSHGGLGVGLALVKDLVELHGGQVRVESPGEKKGATFTVELPLTHAAREAPERPGARMGAGRDAPRELAGIRVLVVDDDSDICEVLQFVLEGEGALVTVAASAAEALAALERSMPNVLLSDIAMPGETGHDLMRKIVAREGDCAPPAAALSAYAREQDRREALASGFRVLLSKPIEPGALIAAVVALAGANGNDHARRRVESGRL